MGWEILILSKFLTPNATLDLHAHHAIADSLMRIHLIQITPLLLLLSHVHGNLHLSHLPNPLLRLHLFHSSSVTCHAQLLPQAARTPNQRVPWRLPFSHLHTATICIHSQISPSAASSTASPRGLTRDTHSAESDSPRVHSKVEDYLFHPPTATVLAIHLHSLTRINMNSIPSRVL